MVVYMVTSPLFGILVDKQILSRRVILALGIVCWSVAASSAYFATDLITFLVSRALVGIGEAAYINTSVPLLGDFYPPEKRSKIFALISISTPVGSAIGFTVGGFITQYYGWRYAYLYTGLPGLGLAFLILGINDPGIGVWDATVSHGSWSATFKNFKKNLPLIYVISGLTFSYWSIGGMADWLPTYFSRTSGADISTSATLVGGATVISGIVGTLIGAFVGDKMIGVIRQPYFGTSAVATLISSAIIMGAIFIDNLWIAASVFCLGEAFLFSSNGLVDAIIINSVPPEMRSRAYGLRGFITHLLGDSMSPLIIGAVSDHFSLRFAAAMAPIMIFISGIIFLIAWRTIPESTTVVGDNHSGSSETATTENVPLDEDGDDYLLGDTRKDD
eukprot:TRINITY_DN4310_c0_g1_i3.p1 TRINITY_DN4310_c0_g1~~TRINITY_DN4310_c0_g1_i3.p1  ORF type:complete len:389 (-),score=88.04 TRINITY_DN4310_c0_g1_i3:74-1240(-)